MLFLTVIHNGPASPALARQSCQEFVAVEAEKEAWAEAVAASKTELVAFLADQAEPRLNWVASLKQAYRIPWHAVGPAVDLLNPSVMTWAWHLQRFGPWAVPASPMGVAALAPGLGSYRRQTLLECPKLDELLPDFLRLDAYLTEQGCRLFLDPRVEVAVRGQAEIGEFLRLPGPGPDTGKPVGLSRLERLQVRLLLWVRRLL